MDSRYPKPDRSGLRPNREKTMGNDVLDIGWQEEVMTDGRPFRGEFWCQDQVSMITFFFSSIGLENCSRRDLEDLLVSENLVHFNADSRYVDVRKVVDTSGNDLWSVNVAVGDEDDIFVRGGGPFRAYS